MEDDAAVEVSGIVDGARFGPCALTVSVLTTLALVFDGFDIQAIGFAAPRLMSDWGIDRCGTRAHPRRRPARDVRRCARARDRGRPLRPAPRVAREYRADGRVLAAGRHRGRARTARDLAIPHRPGARRRAAERHRADVGVHAARHTHGRRCDHGGRRADRRNNRRRDRHPARTGVRLAVHLRGGRSAAGSPAARDGLAAAGIAAIPRAPAATREGTRQDSEPRAGRAALPRARSGSPTATSAPASSAPARSRCSVPTIVAKPR